MQKWIRNLTANDYMQSLTVGLKLDKQMRIASMGSCFAREIRQYLLGNGFNYMMLEQNKNPWLAIDPNYKPNEHGSAAWDRVFNTFTLAYIVKSAFGQRYDRLVETPKGIADIIRTRVVYPDMNTAVKDLDDHLFASQTVLLNADVLVITLGLTEVWMREGLAMPYLHDYIDRGELTFYRSTVEDSLEHLHTVHRILMRHNPGLKLLLTLSPIHMNATFRDDVDVFSASCASKSILRTAIDSLCSHYQNVYYFPSYEIATILCPELGVKTYRDGHHISKEAFTLIEHAFERLCN